MSKHLMLKSSGVSKLRRYQVPCPYAYVNLQITNTPLLPGAGLKWNPTAGALNIPPVPETPPLPEDWAKKMAEMQEQLKKLPQLNQGAPATGPSWAARPSQATPP